MSERSFCIVFSVGVPAAALAVSFGLYALGALLSQAWLVLALF